MMKKQQEQLKQSIADVKDLEKEKAAAEAKWDDIGRQAASIDAERRNMVTHRVNIRIRHNTSF